ncbi:MAG: universal stress protein [Acidiferrobacterales bacterium]|jgi:nucleotide-binding universal stress UspA family protein|nr:universal stress protein [Acidiferrobacterales bacterium]
MLKTILLCYDGSREGQAVLDDGAELALRFDADTHLLAVIQPSAAAVVAEAIAAESPITEIGRAAEEILKQGIDKLTDKGLKVEGHIVEGQAVEQIALMAREIGADLVVLGHRHRGPLERWWQNSVGSTLLDESPCSILIALGKDGKEA